MTLQIPLLKKSEAKLRNQADAASKNVATFVREAVEEKLSQQETFVEILAPVHDAFRKSGLTERKAMDIYQRAREGVHHSSRK